MGRDLAGEKPTGRKGAQTMNKKLLKQTGRMLVLVLTAATCAYWGYQVGHRVGWALGEKLVLITTGYVARRDAR